MKLKFKFTHRGCPLFAALLLAASTAQADVVTLNNGEKYDGKVVSETDTAIVFEYNLTPKIKDKKEIKRSDIKELIKLTPSQMAFAEEKLAETLPTPDLMSGGDYERIIQDKLRTFVAKHPGTPEAAEVEKMIAELSAEKSKVVAGEVKMEGKWLDAETAKREAYNIDAYRTRMAMKAALVGSEENRYREALTLFEKLRTQYGSSTQYVEAIPEALDILAAYQKQLGAMAAEQPVIQKQREEGLKSMSGADLALTKSSIDQEARAFKSTIEAQTKQKVKWRDVYKYDLNSIQAALDIVTKEIASLRATDLVSLRSENETLGTAIRYMAEGNPEQADAALDKLRGAKATMLNKNELARLEKELRSLRERVKAQQKASGVMPVAAAAASEGGQAPAANPIEEAMRQREKEKQEKAAGKGDSKEKKTTEKKGDDKKITKPKSDDAEKSGSTSTPEPEPGLLASLNDYIPYIGGGLLLILILAMVFGKKKKAAD